MPYRLHADIVGFSEEFYRKYPKEWQKNENHWDELFSEMEVNINVEAHIRGRIAQLFLPFYGPLIQTIIPLFLLMVAMGTKKNPKQTESSNMNN